MRVTQLQLYQFRNYKNLNIHLGHGVNIFVGNNGQGKTNLVEAIYLLTRGSSFRPTKSDSYLSRSSTEKCTEAFVGMRVHNVDLDYFVKLKLSQGKKNYFRNEKRVSGSQLAKDFPVVLFSPESLASIKEGPDYRRQLVDDWLTLIQPKSVSLIADFKKTLKARNKILKTIKQNEGSIQSHRQVLLSLNEIYLQQAAELTHARIQALKAILPPFAEAMKSLCDGENVDISVDYLVSSESVFTASRDQILDMMKNRIQTLNIAEEQSGTSLIGPHKHDICFFMNGEDSRFYCSQGQQRALILAFKMAQILEFHKVFNDYPLLLLDDVLSELDVKKRTHLVQFLRKIRSQIFITTTDLSFNFDFQADQEISVFEIEQGQVKQPTHRKGSVCV